MKRYRLLKDLPGIPAGTEFDHKGCLGISPVHYHTYNKDINYAYWLPSVAWFPEWFQEIPDYSFVKDGDVYTGHNSCLTVINKGEADNSFTKRDFERYATRLKKGGGGWAPVACHYANQSFKPENLVYRPGKNPWDTPEVDKLGWGPMEPGHTEYTLYPITAKTWEVREKHTRGGTNNACCDTRQRAVFNSYEDAELFKKALEGKL